MAHIKIMPHKILFETLLDFNLVHVSSDFIIIYADRIDKYILYDFCMIAKKKKRKKTLTKMFKRCINYVLKYLIKY